MAVTVRTRGATAVHAILIPAHLRYGAWTCTNIIFLEHLELRNLTTLFDFVLSNKLCADTRLPLRASQGHPPWALPGVRLPVAQRPSPSPKTTGWAGAL